MLLMRCRWLHFEGYKAANVSAYLTLPVSFIVFSIFPPQSTTMKNNSCIKTVFYHVNTLLIRSCSFQYNVLATPHVKWKRHMNYNTEGIYDRIVKTPSHCVD